MPERHAWSDNQFEGVALRKITSKLVKQANKIDGENIKDKDLVKLMRIAYCLKDLSLAKNKLAETADHEERIKKLEEAAGLAQKHAATST